MLHLPSQSPAHFLPKLPPRARLVVAALRAGRADLARCAAWEDGELLALCDAAGLRRDAAARLGTCVAFLLREARSPLRVRSLGCAAATGDELAVANAVLAMQDGRPAEAQRTLAAWLPARRRVQGVMLLVLAASDLARATPAAG